MPLDPARAARWLTALHQTTPADRPAAEDAIRRVYAAGGSAQAPRVLWVDSPLLASRMVALLSERYNPGRAAVLAAVRQSPKPRAELDAAAATLGAFLGVASLADALAAAGAPLGTTLGFGAGGLGLHQARLAARMKVHGGAAQLFAVPAAGDRLAAAESALWGANDRGVLTSGVYAGVTGTLIGSSYFAEYNWSMMAADEQAAPDAAPDVLRASWDVARTASLWWPFQHLVIASERPAEIHVDEAGLPHRGDGPAVVYRDGWAVFAWSGKAIESDWVLHPESIPAARLRKADPALRRIVESRRGARPQPPKPSALFSETLPADPAARLEHLRLYAGGRLPLLDRYLAGDHVAVWRDLVAQGEAVRADPLAADALAVATETMRRVALNVDTLVSRLSIRRYTFTTAEQGFASPRVSPPSRAAAMVARLEKRAGTLPLSLRAFYEIVGAVCLAGHHPELTPQGNRIAEDPLWVYGVEDALAALDGDEDAGEIPIAPDDLHKAGQSGGDAYAIGVPDRSADGRLLHARYDAGFVEYLRIAFRCGGFPGYDGLDRDVPAAIAELADALLPL
jgi:uncharacterized protein DUF6745